MTGDGDSTNGRRVGKSESAFRTISEVADELDVPQHVLRFWESKFPQVKPLKRGGGRRYYRPEDVALLRRIRDLLYSEGYTIKGVQKLLREGGHKDSHGLDARSEPELQLDLPADAPVDEDVDGEGDGEGDGDEDLAAAASEPGPAFAALDDGEEEDEDRLEQEIAAVEMAPAKAFSPEIRQELALLLDELEQMRNLLHQKQR